ncbi:unnamed protein product [Linum trigynum]|uniref:Reverse transcriptase zinc-binding domain-containing protein n=1 Tax=Linum trigynum TaxID=586398 RepID=A0AAV2CFN5_9ROSI
MQKWSFQESMSCVLCGGGVENRQHLFVLCPFARQILDALFTGPMQVPQFQTWEAMVSWLLEKYNKQVEEAETWRFIWQTWISHTWRERCRRLYGDKVRGSQELISGMKAEIVYVLGRDRVN